MKRGFSFAVFALVTIACGGSDDGGGATSSTSSSGGGGTGGGAAGAKCSTGEPCDSTNDCLVKDEAMFQSPNVGVCTPRTAACTEGCECVPAACIKSPVCFATGRAAAQQRLFGCITMLRAEDETCELGLGCQDGLFCLIPNHGEQGTCKKLPAGCAQDSFCSECASMKEQCAPRAWQSCTAISGIAFVECKAP